MAARSRFLALLPSVVGRLSSVVWYCPVTHYGLRISGSALGRLPFLCGRGGDENPMLPEPLGVALRDVDGLALRIDLRGYIAVATVPGVGTKHCTCWGFQPFCFSQAPNSRMSAVVQPGNALTSTDDVLFLARLLGDLLEDREELLELVESRLSHQPEDLPRAVLRASLSRPPTNSPTSVRT